MVENEIVPIKCVNYFILDNTTNKDRERLMNANFCKLFFSHLFYIKYEQILFI